jgi:hypothetical protein
MEQTVPRPKEYRLRRPRAWETSDEALSRQPFGGLDLRTVDDDTLFALGGALCVYGLSTPETGQLARAVACEMTARWARASRSQRDLEP